jgi:hypothetical protein
MCNNILCQHKTENENPFPFLLQVFHWTTFSMELWHSFTRIKDIHLILHFILVTIFSFIKYGLLGYKMALNTSFGDGTPITFWEMNEIRRAIHKNMVYSRWEKGDILCIDNFSTSHGRQPTYDKGRSVIVAWSHPCKKNPGAVAQPPQVAITKRTEEEKEKLPSLAESPENSPSSTLSKEEAQELKELFLNNRFEEHMAIAFSKREASKKGIHKRLASCPTLEPSILSAAVTQ